MRSTSPATLRSDAGAAVVDFVLVGSLVTLVFLAVVQLGIDYYVRGVVTACLADGARYAANADVADPAAGAARANEEIRSALGGAYASAVPQPSADLEGVSVVRIEARVRLPLLAWFLPAGPVVHAEGEALLEPH